MIINNFYNKIKLMLIVMGDKMIKIFKSLSITLLIIFIISNNNNLFSKATSLGTKYFKIGATKSQIKKILQQKYKAKDIKNVSKSIIEIIPDKNKVKLIFDYNNVLYKIDLQTDAESGGAAIKKKLITKKYGDPLVEKEKYFEYPKLFLMARWLLKNGRYEIKLYESKYCRMNSYRPCIIVTSYKDKKLEQENNARKENKKIKSKKEKEAEKYDF